ncbi:triacylglycerol lipase [Aeromicrobium marinum DSM 15272]|uniref:Triacylglycerol lipase n=1 Tax=Aeromicrobium marinum DSM 15272 TaxID=585531 RepID=E2SEE8_9ACTN|nr:SGNH/GDSL hydrolase family protein [Aeromicrobium marinum]EFQ82425.1 triacylglycerol lipase [Aeromicrobium marinum DSM 15272]
MVTARVARALTATAVAVALASCSTADPSADAGAAAAPVPTAATAGPAAGFVALGDSFTAGPGIGLLQVESGFCQRSQESWPQLLAGQLGRDVVDLSCAGATSGDLESTVAGGALGPSTDLVTVGAGGNDGGLFLALLRACSRDRSDCRSFVEQRAPEILDRTADDLATLLASIREAAPAADVLLVGYLRILPDAGTCAAVGIGADNADAVRTAEEALDRTLTEAARDAGVTYVPVREASRGHDACAGDEAWTNGIRAADGDGITFHPRRVGMAAVADLVASAVSPR